MFVAVQGIRVVIRQFFIEAFFRCSKIDNNWQEIEDITSSNIIYIIYKEKVLALFTLLEREKIISGSGVG